MITLAAVCTFLAWAMGLIALVFALAFVWHVIIVGYGFY